MLFAVDRERLPELVEAARPRRRLFRKSEGAAGLDSVLAGLQATELPGDLRVLVSYLADRGVPLVGHEFDDAADAITEALGARAFVLTGHLKHFSALLSPAAHSEGELQLYRDERRPGEPDPSAGSELLEAIAVLYREVRALDGSRVLLLTVR